MGFAEAGDRTDKPEKAPIRAASRAFSSPTKQVFSSALVLSLNYGAIATGGPDPPIGLAPRLDLAIRDRGCSGLRSSSCLPLPLLHQSCVTFLVKQYLTYKYGTNTVMDLRCVHLLSSQLLYVCM